MKPGNPQSFNRYSYVENDPVNFVDPSGLNEVAYYVDGFLSDARTAWGHINGGGGYISSHSAGGITVINSWEQRRDSREQWEYRNFSQRVHVWGGNAGVGGVIDAGGGVDDVEKDYVKEFTCNKLAKDVFNRLRTRFSSFANFAGNFGPFGAAFAGVSFGKALITKGATISISNTNIVGVPPYQTAINFNVSVTVSSVSTTASSSMGFSFTTNPGHVLHPATISFTATDTGPGQVSFGISVRGNFASTADRAMYHAGGNGLEDRIWNNLINNVSKYCGNK